MTTYYVGVRICKTDTLSIGGTIEMFIGNGLRCTILGGDGPEDLCAYTDKNRVQRDVDGMTSTYGSKDNTYHVLTIELEE